MRLASDLVDAPHPATCNCASCLTAALRASLGGGTVAREPFSYDRSDGFADKFRDDFDGEEVTR